MTLEIKGTRGKFDMKLRNCTHIFILFISILHRIQATSSKHSKPEVAVCDLSIVPTCLKMKEKPEMIVIFKKIILSIGPPYFVVFFYNNRDLMFQLWRHLEESVYAMFTLRRHRVSYLSVAKGSLFASYIQI